MKRYNVHISDAELHTLYTCLEFFSHYYDDAEKEIIIVQRAVVTAYINEHSGEKLTQDEAVNRLKERPQNVRGAGRKIKYTEEIRKEMWEMLSSGYSKYEVATRYECSVSYVEKLATQMKNR